MCNLFLIDRILCFIKTSDNPDSDKQIVETSDNPDSDEQIVETSNSPGSDEQIVEFSNNPESETSTDDEIYGWYDSDDSYGTFAYDPYYDFRNWMLYDTSSDDEDMFY
jgi:hypothetical protein